MVPHRTTGKVWQFAGISLANDTPYNSIYIYNIYNQNVSVSCDKVSGIKFPMEFSNNNISSHIICVRYTHHHISPARSLHFYYLI